MATQGHGAYRLSSLAPKPTTKRPRALSESDSHPHLNPYSVIDEKNSSTRKPISEITRNNTRHNEQKAYIKPYLQHDDMIDEDMTLVDNAAAAEVSNIGLSELIHREHLPKAKDELAVNEPSLTERVEPLLQDLDTAYAQEWEDTIKAHKQEFDETTQHLGDLVDRQSLAIVDDLEHPISQFWQFTDAYIKATHEENDGFLERAMALLAEQQKLLQKLDENTGRIEQRSNKLTVDLTSIRSLTQAALSGCDNEYNQATEDIEKKVILKSDKDLNNDFNMYMMKCMSGPGGLKATKGGRGK